MGCHWCNYEANEAERERERERKKGLGAPTQIGCFFGGEHFILRRVVAAPGTRLESGGLSLV